MSDSRARRVLNAAIRRGVGRSEPEPAPERQESDFEPEVAAFLERNAAEKARERQPDDLDGGARTSLPPAAPSMNQRLRAGIRATRRFRAYGGPSRPMPSDFAPEDPE